MSEIVQLVYERVKVIVTRGFDQYGRFAIESEKVTFYGIAVDLLLTVNGQIESGEIISVVPLKDKIAEGIFTLGFNYDLALAVYDSVVTSLYEEIESSGIVDPDTVRVYKKYESLLRDAISDANVLLRRSVPEYLGDVPEYRESEKILNLGPTRSRLLARNRDTTVSPVPVSRLRKRFSDTFQSYVDSYADVVSNAAVDINAITSDSRTPEALDPVDEDMLVATFAGEGKKIYAIIKSLHDFYLEFSGYQGSLTGSVEYQFRYYEYLVAMCFGKRLPQGVLGPEFGDFASIYQRKADADLVPGLRFLETLYTTRSANQNTVSANPVALRYGSSGIADRYAPNPAKQNGTDFLSLSLESVYLLCLKTGDYIDSFLKSPPEGIGNTTQHLQALAKVFPGSADVQERSTGLTGSIGALLTAYRSLYALLGYKPNLHDFNDKFNHLSNLVSSLVDTVRAIGFRPGGYVPSLELVQYEPNLDVVREKLGRLGFNSQEVQQITGASSFSELLGALAPLTDSQDVISFFRAYDLTKLMYEFGGQQVIDQYVDFLYGVDPDTSILRLLELLKVNRSKASVITGSQYSRLVGYLVTLTYAVDPEQLLRLDSILDLNNIDLFESITLLLQRGEKTALKRKEDVSLLSGMVAQMVVSDNSGYEYQRPTWNALIEASAGNVGDRVAGLYDRAEGITPSELYSALAGPSATSPLGGILDGVRGGRLTSLLRYCNLFGLLYALSGYKNSGQLINQPADRYTTLLEMLDTMEALVGRLYLTNIVFDEAAMGDETQEVYDEPLVQVQNKEFGAMVDLLSGGDFDIDGYNIAESPGIGNSRIPNGVRISNSLTPEEAALISVRGNGAGVFTQRYATDGGSYVRIALSNLLANGVVVERGEGVADNVAHTETTETPPPTQDYVVSYVPDSTTSNSPATRFDPLVSCRKFGTTDCVDKGYDPEAMCATGYNKSLFPETGYGTDPFGGGSVTVDRVLGSGMARNITYNKIGETDPQRYFTANGLSEASRSSLLKDTEMSCASLRDPYEYGACMSLLKCKKFLPPYAGRYDFAWCPTSLHGGRYRQ